MSSTVRACWSSSVRRVSALSPPSVSHISQSTANTDTGTDWEEDEEDEEEDEEDEEEDEGGGACCSVHHKTLCSGEL